MGKMEIPLLMLYKNTTDPPSFMPTNRPTRWDLLTPAEIVNEEKPGQKLAFEWMFRDTHRFGRNSTFSWIRQGIG